MGYMIKATSGFLSHTLDVGPEGVVFIETTVFGGKKRFAYGDIDLVLMSPTNVLSFQAGSEVFSIQTKPEDNRHHSAIDALLRSVERTRSTVRR